MKVERLILLASAVAGLTGVILAAVGSHLAPGPENFASYKSWQAANNMHLLHAVALMALCSLYRRSESRLLSLVSGAFTLGIILFSGSIYLSLGLSLPGLSAVAPMGGMLLMLGWLLIAVHALGNTRW